MLRKLLAMTICFVLSAALAVMNLGTAEELINDSSDSGSGIGTALLTDYWMDASEATKSLNDYLLAVISCMESMKKADVG